MAQVRKQMVIIKGGLVDVLYTNDMLSVLSRIASTRRF